LVVNDVLYGFAADRHIVFADQVPTIVELSYIKNLECR